MRSHSLRKFVPAKTNSLNLNVPRSRKSAATQKSVPVQEIDATNSGSTGVNQLKPAKRTRNRVPLPQRERILQKSIAGKSVTQIAREENRNRETVARIVNGAEVRELVRRMRSEVYGLANDAVATVRHALQEQKDARVGYKLLMDIGAIPLPAEAEANAVQAREPEPEELTPFQRAAAEDESGEINPIRLGLARFTEKRSKMLGIQMPKPCEVWHCRTVSALLDELTNGQTLHMTSSDSEEYNRLKGLAEEILQGKRTITDKEIIAVRKRYSE